MSQAESQKPLPDGEAGQSGAERSPEGWLDRLKAAVSRLKAPASFREDLAEALANDDVADSFTAEERAMLGNILRLRDVRVADAMVPRADIEAVEVGTTLGQLFLLFEKSGHSRMPVYRETLDDPVGFVHIKDLVHYATKAAATPAAPGKRVRKKAGGGPDLGKVDLTRTIGDAALVRNILFVPPSMPVTALLAKMQATRMQIALVIDEYGGTDGLVSLEDVVEMVVGDIEDEHDDEEGPMIVPDGDGFIADARADLAEVSKAVGMDLAAGEDNDEIDTVGGLAVSIAGRVPVRGELIAVKDGLEFEILDADPRRIKRLRIYRRDDGPKPEPRRRKTGTGETAPEA